MNADRIRELIEQQGATPGIAPKSNRRRNPFFSKRLHSERDRIERFFSKLKDFLRSKPDTTSSPPTSLLWFSSPQCGFGSALRTVRPSSLSGTL